ncbi:MAG: hypothetical protein JNL01_17020 [Bdellovibrionales bacterium]|nr:hypothetical protein [Bdellovibrionales bacterium]
MKKARKNPKKRFQTWVGTATGIATFAIVAFAIGFAAIRMSGSTLAGKAPRSLAQVAPSPAASLSPSGKTNVEIIKKYWNYRKRLFEKFIHLKGGPADALLAGHRDGGNIVYSDGTVDLGWYLAVLGSELELLKSLGKPTANCLFEISRVLDAQDRLTEVGNRLEGKPGSATGYFARDDADRSVIGKIPGVTHVESDFLSSAEYPTDWGYLNHMSQDQAVNLLLGYRVLAHTLETSDQHLGKNLRMQMETQVSRILKHMYGQKDWIIRFPGTQGKGSKVRRGPNAAAFSKALVGIGKRILGESQWDETMKPVKPALISYPAFEFLKIRGIPYPWWTQAMILILGTTGDAWGKSAKKVLSEFSLKLGFPLYPLLHAHLNSQKMKLRGGILNRKDYQLSQDELLALLVSAPFDGPNGADKTTWCNNQRFYKERRLWTCPVQWEDGDYRFTETTEFPGTDYMLFHNLYQLYYSPEGVETYTPTPEYEAALKAAQ